MAETRRIMLVRPEGVDGRPCARHNRGVNERWPSLDPLGEALHSLRMSGIFYSRCEFTAPWGLVLPAFPATVIFHVVTAGRCWLEVEGAEPRHLLAGDLALVPRGAGHRLNSAPDVPAVALFDLPRAYESARYEILRHGGGGAAMSLV